MLFNQKVKLRYLKNEEILNYSRQFGSQSIFVTGPTLGFESQFSISPFAIETQDGTIIGLSNISRFDFKNSSCFLAIQVFPKGEFLKDEIASIISELVKYLFDEMHLFRIQTSLISVQAIELSIFNAIGFQIEGTLKEHTFFEGEYVDVNMLSLLK